MKRSVFYCCYWREYEAEQTQVPFLERVIDYAKRDGFDGVEYLPYGELETPRAVEYAKRLREKLDANGMACPCYSVPITMVDDPRQAPLTLKRAADIAKALGAPYLHHTFHLDLHPQQLPAYEEVEPLFVQIAREVAAYAAEQGLGCLYEEQGFLMNTPERLGSLLEKVAMPNTGVCLDAGNSLFTDTSPEVYAQAFAAQVRHVHIKDYHRSSSPFTGECFASLGGQYLQDATLGEGMVDTQALLLPLAREGYDGWFSLESCVTPVPRDGIRQSMSFFEQIYRQVFGDTGQ